MKIGVLLRGFHYLERDRFGFPLNALKYLPSFENRILIPLRENHEVKVFIATYPSPVQDQIISALNPTGALWLDSRLSNQLMTYYEGITYARTMWPALDRLICVRFDLSYRKSITKWKIWDERQGIFFPWKEYRHFWKDHQRVGDAVHVVDRNYLELFAIGLAELKSKPDFHMGYHWLSAKESNLHFIEDGYFDSNTLYCNRECWNPLYRIANRPRLPASAPYRFVSLDKQWKYPRNRLEHRWAHWVTRAASTFLRILNTPKNRK